MLLSRCYSIGDCLVSDSCFFLKSLISKAIPVNKIKLLAVLASDAGLKKVTAEFPELEV